MIGFRVDSIGFYANKVDGHAGGFTTTIYIYGLKDRDKARVETDYMKQWPPQGYGTTIKETTDYVMLERRNSCE